MSVSQQHFAKKMGNKCIDLLKLANINRNVVYTVRQKLF